ncbi:MAG: HlyC/CorC family transporter [Gemmatimonadetes bacterium]|nr:hemolysin family protein [Gemmatimonadota bacterium]NNM04510.1 HlyC/CorC family transporter [Gemmatimonadota bacterium]
MAELPLAHTIPSGWLLLATAVFVLLNGFFVAAEFALVKVRPGRIESMASEGNLRAKVVSTMLRHLDLYLSACQLGITLASLILGWLAEPAVASLLIKAATAVGWDVAASPWIHPVALVLALAVITLLHMTVGEQAPKMWAIHRSEGTALNTAYPLRVFTAVFKPLIWVINVISNGLARLGGLSTDDSHQNAYDIQELRSILMESARSGSISSRQRQFGENILSLTNLEVRHIMVPRTEVAYLSADDSTEQNLLVIRDSGHSRYPLGAPDLDHTVGLILARDLLTQLLDNQQPDLQELARDLPTVPDTQPLSRLILDMARLQTHCAIVVDEHGTAVGMTFLEDAIEEIVGPLYDELDEKQKRIEKIPPATVNMAGSVPLPEAANVLGIDFDEETDTVGGWLIATLGRFPKEGDSVDIDDYRATVEVLKGHRIELVRFEEITDIQGESSGERVDRQP